MTTERWRYLETYSRSVFGGEDEYLTALAREAKRKGLPDISVGPVVGRLLMVLTSMTAGRKAIEVGTLGGYSAMWIARGLASGGHLITLELVPEYAAFARRHFARAGLDNRIDLCVGDARETLPNLATQLGPSSIDVVFLDAVKEDYAEYWSILRRLISPGGLLLADNVFGASEWWIGDEDNESRAGIDRFNRSIAADPDFETTAVPLRNGLLVSRRVR